MLLTDIRDEFTFHCQSRKLSPKTIRNYTKQINYLLRFLEHDHAITHIEDVKTKHIKQFLLTMTRSGHSPNYVNDLLKAHKVFFRYAYTEGYTPTLITNSVSNAKASKVIIRTFTEAELKRLINYFQGHDFLTLRNKVLLMLLIDTGIRVGELISLTEAQVKHTGTMPISSIGFMITMRTTSMSPTCQTTTTQNG